MVLSNTPQIFLHSLTAGRREVGGDDEGGKVGGFVVGCREGVIEEEPAEGFFGGLGLGEIFC